MYNATLIFNSFPEPNGPPYPLPRPGIPISAQMPEPFVAPEQVTFQTVQPQPQTIIITSGNQQAFILQPQPQVVTLQPQVVGVQPPIQQVIIHQTGNEMPKDMRELGGIRGWSSGLCDCCNDCPVCMLDQKFI